VAGALIKVTEVAVVAGALRKVREVAVVAGALSKVADKVKIQGSSARLADVGAISGHAASKSASYVSQTGFCVRMRGLPFSASEQDILDVGTLLR
jgi:hypothetical protein